ncbi:putative phosphodiesterase [Escherichia coli]|nr:putative phosphodiesterase [Escherichia coli]
MKLMFASDIHGSLPATERVLELFAQSGAQWLVILGDVLNHGPRNALPEGYAPAKVAERLNEVAHKVIAVRGNCDSEVDQMLLHFPITAPWQQVLLGKTTSVFDAWSSFWPGKSTCFKPERCAGVRSYPSASGRTAGGDFPLQPRLGEYSERR